MISDPPIIAMPAAPTAPEQGNAAPAGTVGQRERALRANKMSDDAMQAEFVLPCGDLTATLAFFTEQLGFRLHTIMPADDPAVAVVSGHGVRLRLDRDAPGDAGSIRLVVDDTTAGLDDSPIGFAPGDEMVAPNGTRVSVVAASRALTDDDLPALDDALVISRPSAEPRPAGRAGMRYRDLIPARHGGRFIASHIVIPDGGPVPDYVHHHRIRFQVIVCSAGWVRVVYEDQGPPFVLHAGDCVLQPQGIRHRVLEASPGAEVVELSCPGEHETHADHVLMLPTASRNPDRRWDGQRFVRHVAADAPWTPSRTRPGWSERDTGIGEATDGLVGVRVLRPAITPHPDEAQPLSHGGELLFWYVLDGEVTAEIDDCGEHLPVGSSVAVPAGLSHRLPAMTTGRAQAETAAVSQSAKILEITAPATLPFGSAFSGDVAGSR
ncbi:MAG: cupin [Actinomycetota bacterium]|nr:cupin [Actinomycetota bacterium]